MFTTLSTIFVPGLSLSQLLESTLRPREMPLDVRDLEGEHDCRLGLPLELGSTEDDLELGAPGLPREAEVGLSGNDVLKFGGVSREKPGISEGFQGLDLTVGEVPLDGAGPEFVAEEDEPGGAAVLGAPDGVARRVGVADLDVVVVVVIEGLAVGVEERAVVLVGVEDLAEGTVGLVEDNVAREVGVEDLAEEAAGFVDDNVAREVGVEDLAEEAVGFVEGNVAREVGVEDLAEEEPGLVEGRVTREVGVDDLEGFVAAGIVGLLVGVEGLLADLDDPEDDGLWSLKLLLLELDEFCLVIKFPFLTANAFLGAGSSWRLSNLDFRAVGRALDIPFWLIRVLWESSKLGKRGVLGGVRSQSNSDFSFSEFKNLSAAVLRAGTDVTTSLTGKPFPLGPKEESRSLELLRSENWLFFSFSRLLISRNSASSSSLSFITILYLQKRLVNEVCIHNWFAKSKPKRLAHHQDERSKPELRIVLFPG